MCSQLESLLPRSYESTLLQRRATMGGGGDASGDRDNLAALARPAFRAESECGGNRPEACHFGGGDRQDLFLAAILQRCNTGDDERASHGPLASTV